MPVAAPRPARPRACAYVGLTKPRIIELLLLTTVPVMFFAAARLALVGLVVATVVGGTLAAGRANALNCVYDRDIDEQMHRTRRRPLPRASSRPRAALVFGCVLGVVSVGLLGVNDDAARRGAGRWRDRSTTLFVYTMVLKRRTRRRTSSGAGAGLLPGADRLGGRHRLARLGPRRVLRVVFFWTPPHTWALAMRYREDYARRRRCRCCRWWRTPMSWAGRSWPTAGLMVADSLLLWPVSRATGRLVLHRRRGRAGRLVRRSRRTGCCGRDPRPDAETRPMKLFHISISYMALLFVAIIVDVLV